MLQNYSPISIAISTKDRRNDLNRLLDSLGNLDYPKDMMEIVVVEEGDSPDPIEGVKYIFIPRPGKGYAYSRNLAVKHCSHDLIAFVDDDCIVTPSWLKNLIYCMDAETSGVTGGVRVKGCGAIGYCENVLGFPAGGLRKIHNSNDTVQPTRELVTCNSLIRKKAILDVGGFDETDTTRFGGEDSLLSFNMIKRDFKLVYSPKAIIFHKTKDNLKDIFFWAIRMGKSRFFFNKYTGKTESISNRIRHSTILKVLLFFLGLVIFHRYMFIYIALVLFLYWLKTIYPYRSYRQYLDRYFIVIIILPIVKFIFDIGLDYGYFTASIFSFRTRYTVRKPL